jgi:alkanesulfonate monooxygenase SsuD/methylene tetrahydromethanopterin reductase-like flavin-dependent oxidoreductase (luciferase family)
MKLGMLMMPLHRPERDYLTVLREDQQAIILADELGFSEVYVGEHYSNKPEQITSPFVFLATLIDRTKQIKLGTGVINLPQQHPAIVAAHAAMFDQLAEGRFIFGIGPGGSPGDFEMFKLSNPPDRPKMMQESIETILRIWSQEPPYEFPGGYWDFQVKDAYRADLGVGVMARPYQKPHPPIAVSIMSPRSSSARTAGGHGWIPISANFTPACHVRTHWEAYAEGCETAGRTPDPSIWRAARSVLVTESDAEAEDYLARPGNTLAFYFNYLRTVLLDADFGALLKDDPAMSDDAITTKYMLDAMVVAGSPRTVAEKLAAFRDEVGDFGTLIAAAHDWDDEALWRRSMTLLAHEVLPRLSRGGTA